MRGTTSLAVALIAFSTTNAWAGTAALVYGAGPIRDDATGHHYARVDLPAGSIHWTQARDEAAGLSFLGIPGHLATVTSAEENAFITRTLLPDAPRVSPPGGYPVSAWLGGFQDPLAAEPGEGWQWVTGEPWSYQNWRPGEPNDQFGEDVLHVWARGSDDGTLETGIWNDTPDVNLFGVGSFIVEFDDPGGPAPPPPAPSPTPIPLPPAMLAGALTLAGSLLARTAAAARRRRCCVI